MSRSSQKEIAQYITTLITTAPCVCEGLNRKPEKVEKLLENHLRDVPIKEAIREMSDKDGHVFRALIDLKVSYTTQGSVDWGGAEGTWRLVLHYLEGFANQEGGHRLCKPHESKAMLGELAGIYRKLAEKAQRERKSA